LQGASLSTGAQAGIAFKYKSQRLEGQIISNKNDPLKTRPSFINEHSTLGLLSMIELTCVNEALKYDGWTIAMQDKLNPFLIHDVCGLA